MNLFFSGASTELFKIYFSFGNVNVYKVFKAKQMARELKDFEDDL